MDAPYVPHVLGKPGEGVDILEHFLVSQIVRSFYLYHRVIVVRSRNMNKQVGLWCPVVFPEVGMPSLVDFAVQPVPAIVGPAAAKLMI